MEGGREVGEGRLGYVEICERRVGRGLRGGGKRGVVVVGEEEEVEGEVEDEELGRGGGRVLSDVVFKEVG